MKQLMTHDEIHDFGIEVVLGQLKKDGFSINEVDTNINSLISIIASIDKAMFAVAVKTEIFPKIRSH
jgi:hypothetical protein